MEKVWGWMIRTSVIMVIIALFITHMATNLIDARAEQLKKNSVDKQYSTPTATKPDPCRKYHEKALSVLKFYDNGFMISQDSASLSIITYHFFFQK